MGSFTNYLEKKILNAIGGNDAPVASLSMWMGLFTAAPSDASGGTECTGGSYARKSTGAWATCTDSGGAIYNAATITYVTASNSWGGVITHFATLDDSATGNMIAWGTLTASRSIATNDVAAFAIGSLTVSLD
jgi:hypothetical protein